MLGAVPSPASWRPIVARLRRATAASMDARGSSVEDHGGGRNFVRARCNQPSLWTVGAEEMRDDDHIEFERLLSPEDIARACGLSRRAVYRAIARGELRAARLCHRLRVHPAELERWIAEETHAANSTCRCDPAVAPVLHGAAACGRCLIRRKARRVASER
jgi:excisionase family DNA binding protein